MCLIFLDIDNHPEYKMIIAANRDEFYNRQTAAAHFWKDHSEILGGRDLEAGGTWLGVNKNGRISMVTNYRDLKNIKPDAPSRGHLVSDYLLETDAAETYMRKVEAKGNLYNGFSLITGSPDELYYYSNYQGKVTRIEAGLHGLSNHLLDTAWPKVRSGMERMAHLLQATLINPYDILDVMFNDAIASDEELPDTGVGLEKERLLSSMFIKSPGYGTRSSTVVMIDRSNNMLFSERVYNTNTFQFTSNEFSFKISA